MAADLYWAWKGVVRELVLSIDAMGGDAGPAAAVAGAAIARRRHPKVHFLLHGDEAILKPLLAKHRALAKRAEIRHAPEIIRMTEKPSQAVRRGRNSSMSAWRAQSFSASPPTVVQRAKSGVAPAPGGACPVTGRIRAPGSGEAPLLCGPLIGLSG